MLFAFHHHAPGLFRPESPFISEYPADVSRRRPKTFTWNRLIFEDDQRCQNAFACGVLFLGDFIQEAAHGEVMRFNMNADDHGGQVGISYELVFSSGAHDGASGFALACSQASGLNPTISPADIATEC